MIQNNKLGVINLFPNRGNSQTKFSVLNFFRLGENPHPIIKHTYNAARHLHKHHKKYFRGSVLTFGIVKLVLVYLSTTGLTFAQGGTYSVGDGKIQSPYETCDDLNYDNGDGCNDHGKIEGGYKCIGEPSICSYVGGETTKPISIDTGTKPEDIIKEIENLLLQPEETPSEIMEETSPEIIEETSTGDIQPQETLKEKTTDSQLLNTSSIDSGVSNTGFWDTNPTDTEIINRYYSLGNEFTTSWSDNKCVTASLNVVYLQPGYDTIPNFLSGNTLYILSSGTYNTHYMINIKNDCSALIGSQSGVDLYTTVNKGANIKIYEGNNVIIENLNLYSESDGSGGSHTGNNYGVFIDTYDNTVRKINSYDHVGFAVYMEDFDNDVSEIKLYRTDSIDLNPEYDTYIDSDKKNENKNYGKSSSLIADSRGSKFLIRFDLSGIPQSSQITNASIRLTKIGGVSNALTMKKILNNSRIEGNLDGGVPTYGEPNYTHLSYPDTPRYGGSGLVAGIDYDNQDIIDSIVFDKKGNTQQSYFTAFGTKSNLLNNDKSNGKQFDFNIYGIQSLQEYIDYSGLNQGFVFLNDINSINIASKENGNAGDKPQLTIDYNYEDSNTKNTPIALPSTTNTAIIRDIMLTNGYIQTGDSMVGNKPLDLSLSQGNISVPITLESVDGQISVDLQQDTKIKKENGTSYTGIIICPKDLSLSTIRSKVHDQILIKAFKVGSDKEKVKLKDSNGNIKKATIKVPIPSTYNVGDEIIISYSNNGNSRSRLTTTQVQEKDGTKYIQFQTDHFTQFSLGGTPGEFRINSGDPILTDTTNATLYISGSNIDQMKFGDDYATVVATGRMSYSSTYSWSLPNNQKSNVVRAMFSGDANEVTVTDQIYRDDSGRGEYLNEQFRSTNPSDNAIKHRLYGDGSRYIANWTASNCDPKTMYVEEYMSGEAIPTSPSANTVYVINTGAYEITSSISISAACIAFVGKTVNTGDSIIIKSDASIASIFGISASNIILDNLHIDNLYDINGSTHTINDVGISFSSDQQNSTINRIDVYGASINLYISQYDYLTVDDSNFYNANLDGISMPAESTNNTINNSLIYNNGSGNGKGIYIEGSYNTINNSQIFNNQYAGIKIEKGSYNVINNSQIYNNNTDGLELAGSSNNIFNRLWSYNNANYGIYIVESTENYYAGELQLFDNNTSNLAGTDGNDGYLNNTESPPLGRSSGSLVEDGGPMSCTYMSIPTDSQQNTFNGGCDSRGNLSWDSNTQSQPITYIYDGSDPFFQIKPAYYDSTTLSGSNLIYFALNHMGDVENKGGGEAAPACGDGTVDAGEQCDDSNTSNGDGCSSTCQRETQYAACTSLPSSATGNTATGITQTCTASNGSSCTSRSPSSTYSYSYTPSTTQCYFLCNGGYNRNGSTCAAEYPSYARAVKGGGTSDESAYGVATDSNGNSYVAGYFAGTGTFGSTTLVSSGGIEAFVAKLSSTGVYQRATKGGGTGSDKANGITIDSGGNSYVAGYFGGTATFGSTTLIASGQYDQFIGKLSSTGVWLRAVKGGGPDRDVLNSITIDSNGNTYVAGYFNLTGTFGSIILTSSDDDAFVAKLSSTGVWLRASKGGGTGEDRLNSVAIDSGGNSYVAGYFDGTATFGSTTLVSSGLNDTFVAKLSATGVYLRATKGGGTNTDRAYGVAVDSGGNSYVAGYFRSTTANFGTTTLTNSGNYDTFVAKLSSTGVYQRATKGGGDSDDRIYGIAVDSGGNSYVAGNIYSTANFGSKTLVSNGQYDTFIAKLSSTGAYLGAVKGGGATDDRAFGVAVDNAGNSYMVGNFNGTNTFGSTILISSGNTDVFVAKFSEPSSASSNITIATGSRTMTGTVASGGYLPLLSGYQINANTGQNVNGNSFGYIILSGVAGIRVTSGTWNGILYAPTVINSTESGAAQYGQPGLPSQSDYTLDKTISMGGSGAALTSSGGNFQVSVLLSDADFQSVKIYYSDDGGNTRLPNTTQTSCTLDAINTCTFQTNHFSNFTFLGLSSSFYIENNTPYTGTKFVTLNISVPAATGMRFSNEGTGSRSAWTGIASTYAWTLSGSVPSSGSQPKLLYAEFVGSGITTQDSDDIILDTLIPSITITTPSPISGYNTSGYTLNIGATIQDDAAGLGRLSYLDPSLGNTGYIYSNQLLLMLNFDDITALGEDSSTFPPAIVDLSDYSNNNKIDSYGYPTWTGNGKRNGAYIFNGIDNYMTASDGGINSKIGSGFTVSARIYLNDNNKNQAILSNYYGDGGHGLTDRDGIGFTVSDDNRIVITLMRDGITNRIGRQTTGGTIAKLQWYHVAATRNGTLYSSGFSVYVDGKKEDAADAAAGTVTGFDVSLIPMEIGKTRLAAGATGWFDGIIDEVRIYKNNGGAMDMIGTDPIETLYRTNLAKTDNHIFILTGEHTVPSDGTYTYDIDAQDYVGNGVSNTGGNIIVDNDPPTGTFNINSGASSTTSSGVYLINTGIAGAAYMRFANGSSPGGADPRWTFANSTGWTLAGCTGATYTVYGDFKDAAGNTYSTSDSITCMPVSISDPTLTTGIITSGTTGVNGSTLYYKGTINIRSDVTDNGGANLNTSSCQYTTNGSSRSAATFSGNVNTGFCYVNSLSPAANINVRFRISNTSAYTGYAATGAYIYDGTAPSTTDNVNSNWTGINQTITLSPIDGGVGVSGTYYCVYSSGDTACTPSTSGTSVSVTCLSGDVCQKYIRYQSNDKLGNTESIVTSPIIKIDKQAPQGGYFTVNSGASFANSTGVTLNVYCPQDDWIPIQYAYGSGSSPSNRGGCVSGNVAYTLQNTQGSQSIYMRFRDSGYNTTPDVACYINYGMAQTLYVTGTRYTSERSQNSCNPATMTTIELTQGTDKIPTNLSGNTIYVLRPGKYIQSSTVNFSGCTALVGLGEVVLYGTTSLTNLLYVDSKNNVIISNIKADGKKDGLGSVHDRIGNIINFSGVQNSTINNVQLFNGVGGIMLRNNSLYNTIMDVRNYNNLAGITLAFDSDYNIIHNAQLFNNNYRNGGLLQVIYGSDHNTFNNIQLYNNYRDGLVSNEQYSGTYSTGNVYNNISIYNVGYRAFLAQGNLNSNVFRKMNIYNSVYGISQYVLTSTNNLHYDTFALYGNTTNGSLFSSAGNASDAVVAQVGRGTGNLSTTGPTGWNAVTVPINSNGQRLYTGSILTGYNSGREVTETVTFAYGTGIPKQERPVKYSGSVLVNTSLPYNTGYYIGQKTATGDYSSGCAITLDTGGPTVSAGYISSGSTGYNPLDFNNYYKGTIDIRADVSDAIGLSTGTCAYTTGTARATALYSGTSTTGYCYKTGLIYTSTINIKFRIQDSASNLTTGAIGQYLYDATPPTGGAVNINNNAAYTNTGRVNLYFTQCPTDAGVGFSGIYIANTANPNSNRTGCTVGVPITGRILSGGDGTRTVYIKGVDMLGNTGSDFNDDIIVDTASPQVFTAVIYSGTTGNNGSTLYYKGTINIRGQVSDTVGISGNTCAYTTGSSRATAIYSGTATAGYCLKTGLNLTSDITINFRVRDIADNLSTGNSTTYIYDATAPTIIFTGSTPAHNSTGTTNNFTGQMQITENGIGLNIFTYTRQGTTYSVYDSGLVLMMNFDNVSALSETTTDVKDLSQYNNWGSFSTCVGQSCSPCAGGFVAGKWNNAIYSSSSCLLKDSNIRINTGAGAKNTVSFWMNREADPNQIPFSWGQTGNYSLLLNDNCFGFTTKDNKILGISSIGLENTWTHITTTFYNGIPDSGNNEIYINGIKQTITNCTGSATTNSRTVDTSFTLGGIYSGSNIFAGTLDELRIYNRVLSTGEIDLLYRSNLNKFNTSQWLFTDVRMCMLNGSYNYTGYASDFLSNNYSTGRIYNIAITGYAGGAPGGINLGSVSAGGTSYTLSGQFTGYFSVQDDRGTTGWYTTIQLPLTFSGINNPSFSISQTGIQFRSNTGIIYTIAGTSTTGVYISGGIINYVNFTGSRQYIMRDYSSNPYSCPIGTYGNMPWIKIDIPARKNPDTYSGTLTFDINNP